MKLIKISREDFSLWLQYRAALYPVLSAEYDAKEMQQIFDNDDWYCWFIAEDTGAYIGLVELSLRNIVDGCLTSPVPYLEGLYLIEPARNQGLGTQVLNLLVSWCKSRGYSELATDTELTNEQAQHFYQKFGFEKVDEVVEYKLDIK